MKYKFVAFHTMTRGSGKPAYVVKCAKVLAASSAKVLVLDGLMYEQGAITHQLFEILGSTVVVQDGKNLYDLVRDYESLCAEWGSPPVESGQAVSGRLRLPATAGYKGHVYPDVCARTIPVSGDFAINYLPGNNGHVVDVRERIDFQDLYENRAGAEFFDYIKDALSRQFDIVLVNAPTGHQEISGILCGHMADLILAIDVDSPAVEPSASFEACTQLAARVREEEGRDVKVKSIKGHSMEEILQMILKD